MKKAKSLAGPKSTVLAKISGRNLKIRKILNRAKSWLHHLEQIFLNGNEVIIDRGNNYHKYIRMMRSGRSRIY